MRRPHPDDCPCRLCWLQANDPRYAAALANPVAGRVQPAVPVSRSSRTACVHRGASAVRRLDVPGCTEPPGVYPCALKGECVTIRDSGKRGAAIEASGLPICRECVDRSAAPLAAATAWPRSPRPTTRNLLYHICPIAANETWRANLRQLARRWSAFEGRRVLAIVQGEGLHDVGEVRRCLDELGCVGREELVFPNDPELRETATFLPLLSIVANPDPGQATFFGHTKGNSTRGNRVGAEYWRNQMYATLLDESDACMEALETAAAVGTHKMIWGALKSPYPSRLRHGSWMFAGCFFWFRHDAVFGDSRWRNVPADRYGAEAWLSGLFGPDQVTSRFQPWPVAQYPPPSPYLPLLYPNPISDV